MEIRLLNLFLGLPHSAILILSGTTLRHSQHGNGDNDSDSENDINLHNLGVISKLSGSSRGAVTFNSSLWQPWLSWGHRANLTIVR